MAFIKWTNKFSVGIKKIDEQHKGLFKIIDNCHNSLKSKDMKNIIDSSLNDLMEYVRVHFTTEEDYFNKFNYQFKKEHIQEHMSYIKKVLEFKSSLDNGDEAIGDFLHFLRGWWTNHVLVHDKKYVKYFEEGGLK